MTNETNMTISELIYLFVDCETNSTQDEVLFKALAENPELQKELQESILIRTTLEQDTKALIVPELTTTQLFAKAGISLAPNAAQIGLASAATFGGFSMFKTVASSIVLFLAGAGLAYLLLQRDNIQTPVFSANSAQMNNYPTNNYATNSSINESTSNNKLHNKVKNDRNIPINYATQFENNNTPELIAKNSIEKIENNISKITYNTDKSVITQSSMVQSVNSINSLNNNQNINKSENIILEQLVGEVKLPLVISVSGMLNLANFPGVTHNYPNNVPNNYTLSLAYEINNEDRLGISYGNQSFNYYTFENGKDENATLRNSIQWIGLFYRKSFENYAISNFKPFTQVTLGSTMSGPLGRLQTGIKWQPENSIALTAGVEGSALMYNETNVWKNISTLGFVYQVEIKF